MTSDDALNLLRTTPAWAELDALDAPHVARIEMAARQLAALDDVSLRQVAARYIEDERRQHGELGVPAASRLYVLIRFVFDSPTRAPSGMARFGSFHGIPTGEGWVDEQWPWSELDGRLTLSSLFKGYFGDEYLALDEFDAFRERFGRRQVAK